MPSISRLPARVASASRRVRQLSPLAGGPLGAAGLMLRMRLNPRDTQKVRYQGQTVFFRPSDEQALKEVLLDNEYGFLADRLTGIDQPRVLDVGAHIGTFALWVAQVAPTARIVSVEADPRTFEVLERNFRSAQMDGEVLHRAAGRDDTSVVRFSDDGPSMSHRVDANGSVDVLSISLPSLVAAAGGHVDLAKVDIEGSEENFILGGLGELSNIEALVVELHPNLCDTKVVRAALEEQFDEVIEATGRQSSKPLLYCVRANQRS